MIVTKRANDPVWTNIYAYAQLPAELRRLDEIAHNLWWVWTPKAQNLFRRISPGTLGVDRRQSHHAHSPALRRGDGSLVADKTSWRSWTKSMPTSRPT